MPLKVARVLMTADCIGGVWTFALDLVRALRVDVHLAVMGAELRPAQRREAAAIPNLALHESGFQLEWMDSPWRDVDRAGAWLLSLADQVRPELAHLNHLCHAELPWGCPVVQTGHSCVLSWWRAVKGEEAPPSWDEYRRRVRRSLLAATTITAPSRWMLAQLLRLVPEASQRALAIPNARAADAFHAWPKQPCIFTAGRLWDEAKNLRALNAIAPNLPWPIRVAGELRAPGGRQTDAANVQLLGSLSPNEMANCFASAAIYALPARYEPFGLSVLEAAMSGCPLVLGDIPSLRENWDGAAEFVDPENLASLQASLLRLIGDPARRERLGRLARERARRFHPEHLASAYLAAFRQAQPLTACAS